MAINFQDLVTGQPSQQSSDFAANIQKASGYKPVTQADISQAIGQYGAKWGGVKGQSDTKLYNRAVQEVITWYKKQKADQAAQDAALKASNGTGGSPATGGASSGGTASGSTEASSSSGASRPTSSSSGSPGLPDTAFSTGGTSSAALPNIGLADVDVRNILAGIPGALLTWNPPTYARTSESALRSWAYRAIQNRNAYTRLRQQQQSTSTTSTIGGFKQGY